MHARRLFVVVVASAVISFTMAQEKFDISPAGQERVFDLVRDGMLASIRTSWEQGTAAAGLLEYEYPDYSIFGAIPFGIAGNDAATKPRMPLHVLQMALSAVVRQGSDGRLSQNVGDGLDGASLDGASAGSVVLLGAFMASSEERRAYFQNAADRQLAFILGMNRTTSGAISQRVDELALWADAVYMGPPFLAYYGAVHHQHSLLLEAYNQCRLYRDALLLPGPNGNLWAHIFSETKNNTFPDAGLWATGNAWAALGMLRVAVTITKSSAAKELASEAAELFTWVKEIVDGTFAAINSDSLIPDYISGNPAQFGDASASAALASVAYRLAVIFPDESSSVFPDGTRKYIDAAERIRENVTSGIEASRLGLLTSVVDPLVWDEVGVLSTEGQAFGLMMFAAWRDWRKSLD